MKSRIRIPDHITDPHEKRLYLLGKGECLTSSTTFEEIDRLKGKCQCTFMVLENGNAKCWGVGKHGK